MTHSPKDPNVRSLGELCICNGDLLDELLDDDCDDDPCPHCGGRVMRCPSPVWMEEEEDDC
jgi:hypothetical protein